MLKNHFFTSETVSIVYRSNAYLIRILKLHQMITFYTIAPGVYNHAVKKHTVHHQTWIFASIFGCISNFVAICIEQLYLGLKLVEAVGTAFGPLLSGQFAGSIMLILVTH